MKKETIKTIAIIILALIIMGTVGYIWFINFRTEAIEQGFIQGAEQTLLAIAQVIQQQQFFSFTVGDMNIVCYEDKRDI